MGAPIIQRTFAGGELAPVLHSRADLAKYQQGLRTCRNFFIRREGGASNRSGFGFVEVCKTANAGTRLMRFVASTAGVSYLIEMGAGYFRFYQNGAPLTVAGVPAYNGATAYIPGDLVVSAAVNYYCIANTTGNAPPNGAFWYALTGAIYEVPTAYSLGHLPDWNQSGNVITLTENTQPPRELIFEGATRWILRGVTTAPSVSAPTGLVGTRGAAGTLNYSYIVTTAAGGTYEESAQGGPVAVALCVEPTPTAPNLVTWTAVPGAAEYYIYCDPYGNGVYGFVGTASSNSFRDTGFIPDFNLTPPTPRNLFQVSGDYPSRSANYQQRRFFANTLNEPDSIYGSRTGFLANFGISSPLQDDDSLTFRVAGNNHHPVRWLVALKAGLVLLTDGGEWTVTGANGPRSPLTPSSIDALQETYNGVSASVRPVVVGNAILFVQARGKTVRDLRFAQQLEGLDGTDLGIYASHLFERKTIVTMDYAQVPHSIVWCVRSDGQLLGLTYIPDQDVWGWHRHDTDGTFEDCCVCPESDEDALYVIVKRTIGGVAKRYIERLENRELRDGFVHATSFFVDSGLSYAGLPADEFTGLEHLEGKLVAVYGDGTVVFNGNTDGLATAAQIAQFTIVSGTLTLSAAYANVHIGLPIIAELEPLDLDAGGTDIRDKKKRVQSATLLIERSTVGFYAGPDSDSLRKYTRADWEPLTDLNTGLFELAIPASYTNHGRYIIRQIDPLPLTVLGIIPNVDLGG